MLNRISKGLALIAMFVTVMLLIAPGVLLARSGDDGSRHRGGSQSKAKGTIAAIDTAAGSVTISDRRNGALVTVFADTSTEIRKNNNKNASLADLRVGDRAEARFDRTTFLASRIRARDAKVEGILTSVDLAASTVTITPPGGSPVVLNVTADTKIERNEEHVDLAALQVGDAAEALYDASTMIASKIETTGM